MQIPFVRMGPALLSGLICSAISLAGGQATFADASQAEKIVNTLRMKSEQVKCASLTLEQERIVPVAYEAAPGVMVPAGKSSDILRINLDANRMYCEYLNKQSQSIRRRSTFDGRASVRLTTQPEPDHPFATIGGEKHNFDSRLLDLKPLLQWFRPFDNRFGRLSELQFSATPTEAKINDRSCLVFDRAIDPRSSRTVWVVPTEDYGVARHYQYSDGKLTVQIDITSSKTDGVWVPNSWTIQWFKGDGSLREQQNTKVVSCVLNNMLADSDFSIEIPVGTLVTDTRSGEDYIMRAGGVRRLVTKYERPATYQELLNSESGMARRGSSAFLRWFFYINLTVASLIGAAVLLRFRHRLKGLWGG